MNNLSKGREKESEKIIESEKQDFSYDYNISDIIAKNIFEKILSLTITQSEQKEIVKKIPNYCFKEIKQSLDLAIYMDFLNYDKDDIKQTTNLLNFKSKSQKNINIENNNKSFYNINNLNENLQKKIIKNKSEKLKRYKFHQKLDPNYSFESSINLDVFKSPKKKKEKEKSRKHIREDKEKDKKEKKNDINKFLLKGLIIRDNSYNNKNKDKNNKNIERYKDDNDNEEPFIINSPEEIENIQKIENHKLDYNIKFYTIFKSAYNHDEKKILFDTIKEGSNHWGIISQPSAPSIDRDAGSKIKYEKPILKLKKTKEIIKEETTIKEIEEKTIQNEKEENLNKKNNKKKKKAILFKNNENEKDKSKNKKKFLPIIEFPSEDLDPKLFGRETENEELQQLRDNLEREIAEKKLEIANKIKKEKEEQALEKEREEKRKELANKNVTVDIKGELVYIKSLDINQFMNDFTKSKSKYKDIKTIEYESKIKKAKRRQSTTIEKNPDIFKDFPEPEIPKKKNKQKNRKNMMSEEKNMPKLGLGFFFDKNREPIISAGSNFDIMNPVCGVNLTEDKKMKSGGKDFFHKYNKYSIQVFEETLNRTISSNFYQNNISNIINNTTNNNVMSLKKKKTIRDIMYQPNKEKEKENKKNKTNNISVNKPNESNDKLLVKTKNLKIALNNLDLITEGEEKYLSEKKNFKNKNVIKRNQFIDFNKQKYNDYNEIDKFAKTLVGSENWGENIYNKSDVKRDFRKPKKPDHNDFKREVPENILNRLPRKRLPPINVINRLKENNFGKTMSEGFFNKDKKKKLKPLITEENKNIQNETDDNNNNKEKKNDFNFSTTSNFYKNTIS